VGVGGYSPRNGGGFLADAGSACSWRVQTRRRRAIEEKEEADSRDTSQITSLEAFAILQPTGAVDVEGSRSKGRDCELRLRLRLLQAVAAASLRYRYPVRRIPVASQVNVEDCPPRR